MASLGSLVLELAANIANFQSDLSRAERAARESANQMQRAFADVGKKIAAGITGALATVGFGALIKSSIDAADKLQDLSNRIGGNVKTLSELKFAAEQSGASFETLSRGLLTVSKNAAAAAGGNEAIANAFSAIGVSVSDSSGALKSADALLSDVAEQFAKYRDGPEKAALALKLFGKSGVELIPVLNEGKQGLAAFAAEAERLGASIDGDTASSAAAFNDTMDQVKTALQGVGLELARTFLPLLQKGAEALREFLVAVRESAALELFAKAVANAGEALRLLAVYVGGVIAGNSLKLLIGLFSAGAAGATAMATATAVLNGVIAKLGGPIGLLAGGLAVAIVEINSTNKALREAEAQMIASAAAAEASAERLARVRARASSQDASVTFGNQQFFEDERKTTEGILRQAERLQEVLNSGRKPGINANFYKNTAEDLRLLEAQFVRMGGSAEKFKAALEGAGTGAKSLNDTLKPAAPILQNTAVATEAAAKADKAMADAAREAEQAVRSLLEGLKAQAAAEREQLEAARDLAEVRRQQSQNLNNILAEQERELSVLQASGQQRQDLITLFRAQDQAAGALGKSYNELTQAERDSLAVGVANIQLGEQAIEQARKQAEALDEQARYWEQVGNAAADALGEFAVEALTNFDDVGEAFDNLADSLGDIAKRTIAQIISEFARLKVINPLLNNILGTNLQTSGGILGSLLGGNGASAGAGQAGGIGGILSGLFGGGSGAQGGGLLSSLGSLFGSGGSSAGSLFAGPFGGLFKNPIPTTGFGAGLFGNNVGGFGSTAGNALGAAGGLYGVYSAFRSGSPLSGAASGAALGTSILPGIGTAIGAIVGALAGILGGPKTPDLRLGGVGVTRKPEGTFTTALGSFQFGARGLEGKESEFVKLVTDFDKTIAGIVGSFTGGSEQLDKVRAALARFSVDLKGDAITAENLLGQRLSAILATFDADVQAFVGSVGTVEERAGRLADAAVIVAGVETGFVDSFTALAGILKDNRIEGEDLSATYARVVGAFELMDGVLNGLGLTTDLARNSFVTFAADVVTALGGLDSAASIINRNLSAFLSPDEQRQVQLRGAQTRLESAGVAAGITAPIGVTEFRSLLDQAFAGAFDPQRTAAILAYGAAFADLNELLGSASATTQVVIEAIAVDLTALEDASRSVFESLADFGRTDYQRQTTQIREQFKATAEGLEALRRASGDANAELPATAAALQLMVLQLAEARNGLERNILRSLIDLYGEDSSEAQRAFTSELDLLQNGFRVAAEGTQNWVTKLEQLERLDAATTLARNLRSFFEDSAEGIAAGLEGIDAPIDRILTDLGVSFENLYSPSSIDAFTRAAGLLGLSADELGRLAGLDLSRLDPTQRANIDAAGAQAAAGDPVVGGLAKVETAANETTDEVERQTMTLSAKLDRLIAAVLSERGDGGQGVFEAAAVIA